MIFLYIAIIFAVLLDAATTGDLSPWAVVALVTALAELGHTASRLRGRKPEKPSVTVRTGLPEATWRKMYEGVWSHIDDIQLDTPRTRQREADNG